MNDVDEMKQFAVVHARTQGIPDDHCAALLAGIDNDAGDGPGSWTGEWAGAGRDLEVRERLPEAVQHYVMARFPYVDGPARRRAHLAAIRAFSLWRTSTGLERLDIDLPGGRVRCWALPADRTKPTVVVLGGIVSVKEQWAPLLLRLSDLGFTGVVTEMPSCGENSLRYDEDSWRMFPAILDAYGADHVYALAMSFSGHMALRWALEDERVKGILTVGAPVHHFFTNRIWQQALPQVTIDTLAHLTGTKPADVGDHVRDWMLTPDELQRLQVPLAYVASLRDEIIPPQDPGLLRRHVRQFSLLENDDVHGSPGHTDVTAPWLVKSLLEMSRGVQ